MADEWLSLSSSSESSPRESRSKRSFILETVLARFSNGRGGITSEMIIVLQQPARQQSESNKAGQVTSYGGRVAWGRSMHAFRLALTNRIAPPVCRFTMNKHVTNAFLSNGFSEEYTDAAGTNQ